MWEKENKENADLIKSLISYDADSGLLTWKVSPRNGISVGDVCGSESLGYIVVGVKRKYYFAHRIAWMLHYDKWPEKEIDHINKVSTDNRISNLRLAMRGENQRNIGIAKNNTSGIKGVCWCSQKNRWRVGLCTDGKRIQRYFREISDAEKFLIKARADSHKDFSRQDSRETLSAAPKPGEL